MCARWSPTSATVRPLLLVVPAPGAGSLMAGEDTSAVRRDRRRRGLDQRALLHDRRDEGVVQAPGARPPQGVGRPKDEATPRSRFTAARASCSTGSRPWTSTTPRREATVSALNGDLTSAPRLPPLGLDHKIDGPGHVRPHRRPRRRAAGDRRRPAPATASRSCSPRTPTTSSRRSRSTTRPGHLGGPAAVDAVHQRRATSPPSCWCSPGRTSLVAERERWPEGRYLAVDLQLVCERNDDQAGRRGRPGADLPVARSRWRPTPRATSGGPRRSTSRSSTPSGSARTCARASGSRSRSSPTRSSDDATAQGLEPLPDGGGAAAGQAVAALPLPDPLPALRRGVARAGRAADGRDGVRPRLQPRPAARADAGRADDPALAGRHPPLRVARRAVPARRPGPRAADGRATPTGSSTG